MNNLLSHFRQPSPLLPIKDLLPGELIYHIKQYLVPDTPRADFAMVLVYIPYIGKQIAWPRPFSPCERCRKIKTHNKYCSPCDAQLWLEID